MMKFVVAAALLAGCFPHPSADYACQHDEDCESDRVCGATKYCVLRTSDGGDDDSGSGSGDLCEQFPARHFDACMIPEPTDPLNLTLAGEYKYDTGTGVLIDPGNNMTTPLNMMVGELRVLSINGLTIAAGAQLRVTGAAPLVVASWDAIDISGLIDVSSTPLALGAGSAPSTCTAHAALPGVNHPGGGDGGGGGGNGTAGGTGGVGGTGDNMQSNTLGDGQGAGGGLAAPPLLSGGCPGAQGGTGQTIGGLGGPGGGAIQLTARTTITIQASGRINAGGAGGVQGATNNQGGGGGGGGAGGMVGLEAPMVSVVAGAIIAANGGGGGQGGGGSAGSAGQNAQLSQASATGGTGGTGGVGGIGGNASTTALTMGGHHDGAGGGGGGGSAGYIAIKGTRSDTGAVYSPAPIVVP